MSALPPAGEPDVMPPADPVAVDLVGVADEDPRAARALGRRRRFGRLRRGGRGFWTQPAVVVAVCILGIWVLVAAAAPWLAPYDPIAQSADLYAAPSSAHWFGTDELGRDVFSRVLYGARLSIPLAAIIVAAALAIGGVLGLVAGYLGRFADEGLMRLTDLVFAFPQIILAMAISAAFGPSARNAVVALVIVSWPVYARVIRSAALAIRGSDYLASARCSASARCVRCGATSSRTPSAPPSCSPRSSSATRCCCSRRCRSSGSAHAPPPPSGAP